MPSYPALTPSTEARTWMRYVVIHLNAKPHCSRARRPVSWAVLLIIAREESSLPHHRSS